MYLQIFLTLDMVTFVYYVACEHIIHVGLGQVVHGTAVVMTSYCVPIDENAVYRDADNTCKIIANLVKYSSTHINH